MILDNRYDERWTAYVCADCHPQHEEEGERRYEKPYVMLVPEGDLHPDNCPRCESYLGLCQDDTGIKIDHASTPAARWAARQEEAKA